MDEERSEEASIAPGEVRRALWFIAVAWMFGAPFFSIISGAAFTSFLTQFLQADDFTYGLIMAASPAAMGFFFLGSVVAERAGRIKRLFLTCVSAQRLSWFAVAAVALAPPAVPDGVHLAIVGLIAFTSQALSNYGGAGWWAWMSSIVPGEVAGRYFGVRAQLGMVTMATVSTAVVYALERYRGEAWIYAVIFGTASLLGTLDILLFTAVPEVPRKPEAKLPTLKEILITPWQNALFRGFALYTGVAWGANMMFSSFLWRFCFESRQANGLGLSVMEAHLLLFIIPVAAMAWVSPIWGRAIDHHGPRPVLTLSALAAIVAPAAWVLVHPGNEWLVWIAAALTGLTWPGVEQVNFYMTVQGFPKARRSAYTSTFQCVLGLSTTLGIALGGACATFWARHLHAIPALPEWVSHYQPVFATAQLLRLAAFLYLLFGLRLPGSSRYGTVARAIATELPWPNRGRGRRNGRPKPLASAESPDGHPDSGAS